MIVFTHFGQYSPHLPHICLLRLLFAALFPGFIRNLVFDTYSIALLASKYPQTGHNAVFFQDQTLPKISLFAAFLTPS